ncbi:MAG TPA: hypothetical protein V6D06_08520 [Trichocoleus sp.]
MSANPGQPSTSSWASYLSEQDVVRLAQSLRRINTDLMKAGSASAGQRVWYQGGEPYFDIVFELPVAQQDHSSSPNSASAETPENLLPNWCQFTLRGKVLLWTRQPFRLHTGETEELDVPPMLAYYAASKTIRDGAHLDSDFVNLVQQICQARPDQPLLAQLGQILESCKG